MYDAADQRAAASLRGRRTSVTFQVRMTNRGDSAEKLTVIGTKRSKKFRLTYFAGGKNVTATVIDGSYRTETLRSGAAASLTVKVTRLKAAKKGDRTTVKLSATSTHKQDRTDTVSARVRVRG